MSQSASLPVVYTNRPGSVRTPSLLALAAAAASLLALGCEHEPPAPPEPQEYYEIRPDLRRCIAPLCGGHFLRAVNQPQTVCADGVPAEECYVAEADFSALGARVDAGAVALVRGRIEAEEFAGFGNLGSVFVTEAWSAASEEQAESGLAHYRLSDSGIVCVTTPCFSIEGETLNIGTLEAFSGVDLGPAQAGSTAEELGLEALADGRLLAYGVPVPDPGQAGIGTAVAALQFFLPLGTPCFSGGECAGQSCNADEVCLPPPGCRAGADCSNVCSGYCVAPDSECASDADCEDGSWCRFEGAGSRCAPFAGEGESCEGFTLPERFERCAPPLVCDLQDPTGDAGGFCRSICESSGDCEQSQYCAGDGLCHRDGSCESLADCRAEGNVYPLPACVGASTCSAVGDGGPGTLEGVCGIDCGAVPIAP